MSSHPAHVERRRYSELAMPQTKMRRIFYVSVGAGVVMGLTFYLVFYLALDEWLRQLRVGLPLAAVIGLAVGFGYYLIFKLALRTFTQPFLK